VPAQVSSKALHYAVCNGWLYLNKSLRIKTDDVCAIDAVYSREENVKKLTRARQPNEGTKSREAKQQHGCQ
jgi:hypothetical protein